MSRRNGRFEDSHYTSVLQYLVLASVCITVSADVLTPADLMARRQQASRHQISRTHAAHLPREKMLQDDHMESDEAGHAVKKITWHKAECVNDPRSEYISVNHFALTQQHQSMTKEHHWKFSRAFLHLTDAMKDSCGSCLLEAPEEKPLEWKKIWIISDSNDTRQSAMAKQMMFDKKNSHTAWRIWKATPPDEAAETDLTEFSELGVAEYVEDINVVSTYLSHVKLLQRIYSDDPSGEGIHVILEDRGGYLDYDWKHALETIFRGHSVPEDWDILKFGYTGLVRCQDEVDPLVFEQRTPVLTEDSKQAFYAGNLGYIVRPRSIPTILEQLKEMHIMEVDRALMSFHHEAVAIDFEGKRFFSSFGVHAYVTRGSMIIPQKPKNPIRGSDSGRFTAHEL